MMKNSNQFFVLFFLMFSLHGMEYFKKLPWEKQVGGIDSVPFEFQISYKGQGIELDGEFRLSHDFSSTIPALGFYRRGISYLYHTRYLLVQFNLLEVWDFIPYEIREILKPSRNSVDFCLRGAIALHGKLYLRDFDKIAQNSRLVNILYHSWVGEILNKDNNYKVNLPMGIFEPNGIEQYTSLKFDLPHDYAKKKEEKHFYLRPLELHLENLLSKLFTIIVVILLTMQFLLFLLAEI